MRIWIIHQNAYAPSHSASTRHFELARELTRLGHHVMIVASSFYHKSRKETRLEKGETVRKETVEGVDYLWLRTPSYQNNGVARLWNMLVYTYRAWAGSWSQDELPPDIIIGSSPHLFSPWAALKLAKRFGCPFLLEIRDIWPAVPIEMGGISKWHPLMLLMSWLEKLYYRKAQRIISILPFADQHIKNQIGRCDHVTWIPNGSPLDPVEEPTDHAEPLTFMYAGAHSLYSGLDVVLDAAQILQADNWQEQVRFRLIGDGPEKPRLLREAAKRGLNSISFEDSVPKSEVFLKLQEADAFLMVYSDAPLMKWGLCPNKLYDYLGAARPVIFAMATPNNPVAEVNAGVTVKPQDAAELVEGIKQIVRTPWKERVEMGRRGRAYVEKNHNFSSLGAKLETVLLETIEKSQSSRSRGKSISQAKLAASQPIIIIGAPRSGTNMLRNLLTSLPGVETWPCDEINSIWKHGNLRYPDDELTPELATPQVRAYIQGQFEKLSRQRHARVIVEKTCANSLRVAFVERIFPNAKYIFLVRDGRDAVASALKRWRAPLDLNYLLPKARYVPWRDLPHYTSRFIANRFHQMLSSEKRLGTWGPKFQGMRQMLADCSLEEVCAAQWARSVELSRRDLATISPDRVTHVNYESFVQNPSVEFTRIVSELKLQIDSEAIQRVTGQVSRESVNNWRRTLSQEVLDRIAPRIDPQLISLGYPPCLEAERGAA